MKIKNWILASRPKTLPAAIAPVIMGSAIAFKIDKFHLLSFLTAFIATMLIQIGTNLANDYFDYVQGIDTKDRLGPKRVTQSGLIKPEKVKTAFIIIFSLASILGIYLIIRGGWPILIIGILSILCGIWYTAGKYSISYLGLGDLFVLIFFGPIAVGGTFYTQALDINYQVILAGLSTGLISTAILTVNNLRDIKTDKESGKLSLAVRLGPGFTKMEYLVCLITACLIPLFLFFLNSNRIMILLPCSVILFAIPVIKVVFNKNSNNKELNKALAYTGRLLLLFSILFSIGWII